MKKKQINVIVSIILGIFLICFLYFNAETIYQSPFMSQYIFESVSEVVEGSNGNTYIIDNGKKSVVILDDDRRMIRILNGGTEKADFFYANKVCGDFEGNLYIADTISGEQGNRIQKERIIKISEKKKEVILEIDYTECENPPLQYGNILELKEYGEKVYFVKKADKSIEIYYFEEMNGIQQANRIAEVPCDFHVSNASYDCVDNTLYITTRLGEIQSYHLQTEKWICCKEYTSGQMPWDIVALDGNVYYTDLFEECVYRFSQSEAGQVEMLYQHDGVLYAISISGDNEMLTATDNMQFVYIDASVETTEIFAMAEVGNYLKVVFFWLVILGVTLVEIAFIGRIIFYMLKNVKDKSGMTRIALVVGSCIVVAVIASYSTITILLEKYDAVVMNNTKLFGESLRQQIDGDLLKQLDGPTDYRSVEYMNIKNRLDCLVEAGYESGVCYYYVIYNTDGETINSIMDYEDTTICCQPIYAYEDNEYAMVLETGESYTVSETSSYGSWIFKLMPIYDSEGNIVAELEVGLNLDNMVREKKDVMKDNIITVLCSCGVMIMLILECVFALSFFEKRRGTLKENRDITQQMPIRIMVFLVYVTDSMQDSFIAILCSRLYVDSLPLSREIAIALPISIQLLMAALFSAFGGRLAGRYGIRRVMQLGLLSQMLGFFMCMLIPGYMGILIGKVFIGIGMGTVYVTANTMASMGASSEHVEAGFADVSAGVLSGVTIGAGLGSIILSFADYHIVYLIGALMIGGGWLLTISAKNITFEQHKEKNDRLGVIRFVLNRRVWVFFALILVPFMISLSYREYFFPLYVEQYGIDEVQIGRIYLGCGVLVLYIGPILSKYILKTLGARMSIVLASISMAFAMAIFVVVPNLYTVMIGMVVLAITISFAYTCQYTYFEGLKECEQVGMGNAMGIYSMFENIGQTIGPIVYGAALMLGNRMGIGLLFVLMILMVGLFIIFGFRREKSSDTVF